ncbi:MAG: hypothetical protein DI636_06000 [Pelagerythrobacter marensis]|nr:MAG: hypothetical protein DI636_06000 [Pelagerythrobacter marensis]PZU17978.1 MAG: hypothetical protein DI591_01385 [Citromicrobium sp.]
MKFNNVAAALAAATLTAAPVVAQAAPVSAPVEGESEMGRGSSAILAIAAVALFIGGIILLLDDGEDDAISA